MTDIEVDDEIELDDVSNLLEAMDIAADSIDDEAATTWEASELNLDDLKQSLAALSDSMATAEQADWKNAFGATAEVTDIATDEREAAPDQTGDDDVEFVTY